MFADSHYVVLLGLLVGIPTLIFLFLAYTSGHFDALERVSNLIFDEEELRYVRPWETHGQTAERIAQHGPALPARQEWTKWL